jgi:phytoene dehydrogenase-like protein
VQEVFTEAEVEEIEVRKRREEGTPCNKENFEAWKAKFEAEMARKQAVLEETDDTKKNRQKKDDRASRLTGYQQFAANMNFEALEAAAEQAEVDGDDAEEDVAEDFDEVLFQDDDVDLDDLDFDSSDDDVVV